MEKALSIPEILIHIGRFLPTRDLKACMVLSKAWAESIGPWLWWRISTHRAYDPSSLAIISKNAHHTRILNLDGTALRWGHYALFRCLHTLEIVGVSTCSEHPDQVIALLQRNGSTLRSFIANSCRKTPAVVFHVVFHLPSLKSLTLKDIMLRERKLAEAFIQACTHLTRLRLEIDPCEQYPMIWMPSQMFHHLDFLRLTTLDRPNQLGFLKACPNLRTLAITLRNTITLGAFSEVLLSSCPRLCSLFYDHINAGVAAKDLDWLLQNLPPMKCFQVGYFENWNYIPSPFFLSSHFTSLQALQLFSYPLCPSEDVQTILCSCPSLRCISGKQLHAWDINPEIPWVCLGLEHFEVQIVMCSERPALQSVVWGQFSRLTQLCVLSIGDKYRLPQSASDIILGLGKGLELLAPLKRLVHLDVDGYLLDWREEEVEWVIRSWPSLCSIHGHIHGEEPKTLSQWQRLSTAGILPEMCDDYFWGYVEANLTS